jgi:Type I phosphodiesterase / nucleotide pyrophosphatase
MNRFALVAGALALASAAPRAKAQDAAARPPVDNILVVTFDGLRWQELFGGYDATLNTKPDGGVGKPETLAARFDRPTPESRREALLPFLWTVVAREGQILGDPSRGSRVRVTNGLWFSYPGYNEMLAGFADPRIDSNDKRVNPNLTVLEWLNRRPGFEGRVAAFASWDVLPFIVAAERSGVHANGDGPAVLEPSSDRDRLLNAFTDDLPAYWADERFDAATMQGALEHLRTLQPRVLYVMLGETDSWAHGRRYDLYLDAAWRSDRFVRRLWEEAQSLPAYRGRTALVLATDHGRGTTPRDWTNHGEKVPAAEPIWMAVMGPGTPALGVREGVQATQSQLAATVATLLGLGEDFRKAQPKAAPPLADLQR